MPDRRRSKCQGCGLRVEDVGLISWRGNCRACGLERQEQAIVEIAERRGPMYRRYTKGLAIYVASMLPDEIRG